MDFAVAALAVAFASFVGADARAQTAETSCPSAQEIDRAPTGVRAGDTRALASFRAAPQCHHWVTFYFAAEKMFAAGERDEAVRWFYVGQLRGRTVAALDPGASRSVVDALQHIVGQPVNEYAGANKAGMVAAIDWAAAWDRDHPLRMESVRGLGNSIDWGGSPLPFQTISPRLTQARFDSVYAEQRSGMAQLRQMLADVSDEEWRRMRRENGLD
jgi:hypothetical protein